METLYPSLNLIIKISTGRITELLSNSELLQTKFQLNLDDFVILIHNQNLEKDGI